MLVYVDSSALVKLAVQEAESAAMRLYLAGDVDVVISRLAIVEAGRAVRRTETAEPVDWAAVIPSLKIREVDDRISAAAVVIDPTQLRTLDAIHLATAAELRSQLDAFVTYDARLAEAARAHRLPVVSPA